MYLLKKRDSVPEGKISHCGCAQLGQIDFSSPTPGSGCMSLGYSISATVNFYILVQHIIINPLQSKNWVTPVFAVSVFYDLLCLASLCVLKAVV